MRSPRSGRACQARAATPYAWRVPSVRSFSSPTAGHSPHRRSEKHLRRRSAARLHSRLSSGDHRRGGGFELLRLLPHEQRSIHRLGDHQPHQRRARNVRIDREPEHRHADDHGRPDRADRGALSSRRRTTTDQNTPTLLSLYVESKGARDDLPSSLSGRYTLGASTTRGDGIIGKFSGTSVSLALLANQLAGDTVDVFLGELEGDTIRGSYTRRAGASGELKFVRDAVTARSRVEASSARPN